MTSMAWVARTRPLFRTREPSTSVAKALGYDEDKARFETKLGKLAKPGKGK